MLPPPPESEETDLQSKSDTLHDEPSDNEIDWQERRLIAHEVINAILSAKHATHKLAKYIAGTGARLPSAMPQIWLNDIRTHLGDIEGAIRALSDERPRSHRGDGSVLLALARRRASSIPRTSVNFRDELHACVQPLRREMDARGLELVLNPLPLDFYLHIHPRNLRLILNNLAVNAIKYCFGGTSVICGVTERHYGARFSIRNLGVPMTDEEQLRIFELGFRGHNRGTRTPGTGLGLYLVKRVCDFHSIGITHKIRASEWPLKGEPVWHEFHLDFPAELVGKSPAPSALGA